MNHYEIEACVIRAKNGSQEELIKILEQYKCFILKQASLFNIIGFDSYDLVQIGYIALIHAVEKYNAGSHTFSTYAYNTISNSFKNTARYGSKYINEISLNLPVDSDSEHKTEFLDTIESLENLEEDIIKTERLKEVRSAVAKLPSDEMELVIMVYYSNIPLKIYAEKKGITYIQAVRKREKVLEKLGRYIKR